ncbi:alpha/beta hydrolase [Vibrio sp. F12]|nr:alpha/beta hydrolase [Vibrio sp. F12]
MSASADSEANRKYIKDYSIYYIEDSSHFPMLEQPQQFNTMLKNAVKSVK